MVEQALRWAIEKGRADEMHRSSQKRAFLSWRKQERYQSRKEGGTVKHRQVREYSIDFPFSYLTRARHPEPSV